MPVSKEEVLRIAKLSSLAVPEDRLDLMTKQFNQILEYVEQLKEVDTEGIEYTSHVYNQPTPLREDKVERFENLEDVKKVAPKVDKNFFVVPKVIE